MTILLRLLLTLTTVTIIFGQNGFGPGNQDWGYIDVREGAHMFYWLYYTTAEVANYTERPLLVWLQGKGPGSSSTGFGNFGEIGPLDEELNERNYTWVTDANVLFIDAPVGSGFSYVDDESLLNTNNTQIAKDLVEFMKGFMETYPEFEDVPLHILGEGYGGKIAAEFAYVLETTYYGMQIKVFQFGMAVNNAWVSPVDSIQELPSYLFNVGAIDQIGYDTIAVATNATLSAYHSGAYTAATDLWIATEELIDKLTYGIDFYNILTPINVTTDDTTRSLRYDTNDKIEALMNGPVKEALDLTVTWGAQSDMTFNALKEDFLKNTTAWLGHLLNETDITVTVITGQLDVLANTPGALKWVDDLDWYRRDAWNEYHDRSAFTLDDINEGYIKEFLNLKLYWVNRAGHKVPKENPTAMFQILRNITDDFDFVKMNERKLKKWKKPRLGS